MGDNKPAGHAGIIDVAQRAGVSPSTVSRSLRGMPNVSAATRERVLRAAVELSYVASPAASRLASGRTLTVGVVVPFATRWFFAHVVTGAESVLREAGYDLLLYNLGGAEGRDRFFRKLPVRRRVDALLVVSLPLAAEEQARLHDLAIPVVLVGGRAVDGFTTVRIDDAAGAAMAVRHLVHLGHTEIAMVCGDEADLGFVTPGARRAGFERALAAAGTPPAPEHVVTAPWGLDGGTRAMEQLLVGERLPTALFAESDEMALGVLRTLRRAGLAVPGHISVIGFDDHEMADVVELTTIAQPVQAQGETAAGLLLDALGGREGPPRDMVLPTRLVVRATTGPPRAQRARRSVAARASAKLPRPGRGRR